jgi:sensor histidine kinase YesM
MANITKRRQQETYKKMEMCVLMQSQISSHFLFIRMETKKKIHGGTVIQQQ